MKYLLLILCISPLLRWVAEPECVFAQDKSVSVSEDKNTDPAKSIQDKISFYQSELKKNTEAIQTLENELEERKKLNERLSGAIVASQEILNGIAQRAESKAPEEDKEQK